LQRYQLGIASSGNRCHHGHRLGVVTPRTNLSVQALDMNRPTHQRLLLAGFWILAGAVALGGLLDAISNAIALVTPLRATVGSFSVLTIWLTIEYYARKKGIAWSSSGEAVRIRRLGWAVRFGIFGVLALLWLPALIPQSHIEVPPSKQILYEVTWDPNRSTASRATLDQMTTEWNRDVKQALAAVSDEVRPDRLLRVGLRVGTDLFVVQRGEHPLQCTLQLFRLRNDAGLKPLSFSFEEPACEARYEKVSRFLEEVIVAADWGGNQQFLSIQVLLWIEDNYINLASDIGNMFARGQFAFADLDEDGNKELIVTQGTDLHVSRPEEFHFFTLDFGQLVYVEVAPTSPRYKKFMAMFGQILDKSVTQWLGPPIN
jgi:hypothetical protein